MWVEGRADERRGGDGWRRKGGEGCDVLLVERGKYDRTTRIET